MLACKMKTKQGGFTLVELMFTIMVLGVLLGLAVPNFRNFLRNSNLTTSANELLADLNLARTEAIKRRTIVSICSTANPEDADPACRAPDGDNFSGWIVFVDDATQGVAEAGDFNGAWDAGEEILRRRDAVPSGVTAKSNGAMVSYASTGFLRAADGNESATRVFMCDDRGNTKILGRNVGHAGGDGVSNRPCRRRPGLW